MNALEAFISANNLNEIEVLNRLQGEACIISDLCVNAADVWQGDAEKAVEYLRNNPIASVS